MASKKTGKAAGLAALAGLAYMASRDKEGKSTADRDDADRYTGSRTPKAEDATESGDFMSRRLKTNPETGAAYSMDNLSPMSSGKASPAGSRTTPSSSAAPPAGAYRGIRSDMLSPSTGPDGGNRSMRSDMKSVGGGRSGGRGGAEAGEESAMDKLYSSYVPDTRYKLRDVVKTSGDKSSNYSNKSLKQEGFEPRDPGGAGKRGSLNEPIDNFKKGGKVKKMASGGMTSSASKRGDGIASKGKTRCKMY